MNKNQVEKVIWWALKNLLGNLLPFIPFGFLLPIAYPRIKAFFKVFLVGMFLQNIVQHAPLPLHNSIGAFLSIPL